MAGRLGIWRGALALFACGALGVAAAGCSGGGAAAADSGGCEQGPGESGTPFVAVLAQQGSDHVGFGDAGRAALDTVIDAATTTEARVLLAGIHDGSDPAAAAVDTRLVGEGDNDLLREQMLSCRTDLLRGGYEEIAGRPAGARLDVISALRNLSTSIPSGAGQTVDVVLLGSVLNTVAADLREPAVRKGPARSINRLARQGLNFRCEGWRVQVVGGGLAQAGAVASQLREWWRRYFQHCGGALVLFAPRLSEFPVRSGAIPAADRSLIPIEIERDGNRVEATLSGDVLFPLNSAVLEDGAAAVLKRLLPTIASSQGTVEVAGYTDSSGPDTVNGPLSRARAAAVARWLREEAEVPPARILIHGYGSADPVASNATPRGRAKNRRVVVMIPDM